MAGQIEETSESAVDRACRTIDAAMERLEKLRSANDRLRAALKPFADEAKYYDPAAQDGKVLHDDHITDDGNGIRVGDFRAARAALNSAVSQ